MSAVDGWALLAYQGARARRVSSIATVTGCPAGASSATTSLATARPRSSAFQRAREKNWCARSCGQHRDSHAPASIPHTVRRPAWARNPQARPRNVRKDGAVNSEPNEARSIISEAGPCGVASGSIGGNPFHRRGGLVAAVVRTIAADWLSRGCRVLQAARRRTSQTVAAIRSRESASSQPPSIHWNGQNRLAG